MHCLSKMLKIIILWFCFTVTVTDVDGHWTVMDGRWFGQAMDSHDYDGRRLRWWTVTIMVEEGWNWTRTKMEPERNWRALSKIEIFAERIGKKVKTAKTPS